MRGAKTVCDVGGDEHGRRAGRRVAGEAREQRLHPDVARVTRVAVLVEVPLGRDDEALVEVEARLGEGVGVARAALGGGHGRLDGQHEADARVALRDEVADGLLATAAVVDGDRVEGVVARVDQDDGLAAGGQAARTLGRERRRDEHQAVRAARLDGPAKLAVDAVQRAARVDEQVVGALVEAVLDAAEHLHEEERRHHRHDGRDEVRRLAGEALRARVRLVAQVLGDAEHAPAGRLGHARVLVEHPRDGRDGHAGAVGDVVDRDGHGAGVGSAFRRRFHESAYRDSG